MHILIYTNLPVNLIVRLPHPRSRDSQSQETYINISISWYLKKYIFISFGNISELKEFFAQTMKFTTKGFQVIKYKYTCIRLLSIRKKISTKPKLPLTIFNEIHDNL